MARLSASDRKRIPKSEMGLPSKATKKGGAVTGSYPMPDKAHARVAKSYAARFASPTQQKQIDAKANAILKGGKSAKRR